MPASDKPASASKASAGAPATNTAKPAKRKRILCKGQSPREAPEGFDVARAAEGQAAPAPLKLGGRWVWINVWAAWCEPCKEEMPMLIAWRDKLAASGVKLELAFVSIDDDERELTRFLAKQPANGVRASYWMQNEDGREKWFASIGFEEEPPLPVHAFVSPDGKLACVEAGALNPGDFSALAALMR